MNLNYRDIYIIDNPYKHGQGELQDILEVENEKLYMVCTPDIEVYCNTLDQAKKYIDKWILKNGSYEFYTAKQDKLIFGSIK